MAGVGQRELDTIRMGPIAASYKRKLKGGKRWKSLVREAHARGVSINSYLDRSTPMPLKERTTSSLRSEAERTMSSAYAPAEKELSNRERMIQSIGEKRALDNDRWTQWLNQRHGELQANAQAADAAILDRQKQIQGAMIAGQQQNLAEFVNMQNPTGQVSDPRQSANVPQIIAQQQAQQAQNASSAELTSKIVGDNAGRQAATQANNFAFMAAMKAKDVADQWKALQDVADDKDKLKLQRGADSAKEISRLLDREIQKAQTRNEQNIAAASLNVKQQGLELEAGRLSESSRHNMASEAAARARVRESKRSAQARLGTTQEANRIAWYRATHPAAGRGRGSGSGASSSDPQTRFETAYAQLSSSTRRSKDNKSDVPINHSYVAANASALENQLVAKLKITRKMARTVVRAYLTKQGNDPGPYHQYTDTGSATTRR